MQVFLITAFFSLALVSLFCLNCASGEEGNTTAITDNAVAARPQLKTKPNKVCEANECGKPMETDWSDCDVTPAVYPKCCSVPGIPLNVKYKVYIHPNPSYDVVTQVSWVKPTTGYNDLWGYQVQIVNKHGDTNHRKCHILNRKENISRYMPVPFTKLKFDAKYVLSVQSLPGKDADGSIESNKKEIIVTIGSKCKFKEFRSKAICCSITNVTAVYNSGKMDATWGFTCNNPASLARFRVTWTNIQDPHQCYGMNVTSWKNYTIMLANHCQKNNYSIRVYGLTNESDPTINSNFVLVSIPEKGRVVIVHQSDLKASVAAIVGGIVGAMLALCFAFFIYKRYFASIYIQLPSGQSGCNNLILNESQDNHATEPEVFASESLRRVFLLHTHCCDKCNWVVHCLGMMLSTTGLVVARADVWSEQEITSGVMNWYEDEICQASCVVVIASEKMTSRDTNMPLDDDADDRLRIAMQLNLVRGEILHDPRTGKFVPAYFTYNAGAKNIPNFLGSRMVYCLPKDLMKLVYNVLNIEKIQPHRFQPITVLGGDKGHPFEEAVVNLYRAIDEATLEHNFVRRSLNELDRYA